MLNAAADDPADASLALRLNRWGVWDELLISYAAESDATSGVGHVNALWALDRRDEAMPSYDHALALAPDDLSILKDCGTALFHLHRGEKALACFDRALALKPGDIDFMYRRGKVLGKLERYDEAIKRGIRERYRTDTFPMQT